MHAMHPQAVFQVSGPGRVAGHELQREGAPYVKKGNRTHLVNPGSWSTKGEGRALCSCGWTSEILTTASARKKAHREHKALIAAEREQDWTVMRVSKVLDLVAAGPVDVTENNVGETQVTMTFSTLTRLVDSVCGSMSCCAPWDTAEEQMKTMLEQAAISEQIMAQAKRRKG